MRAAQATSVAATGGVGAILVRKLTRFKALNLPTYWAGVNAKLTSGPGPAKGGAPVIRISYPRDAVSQYLEYASMYDTSLQARGAAAR